MKDRIIQGIIAGIIGWAPQFVFTMAMYFGFHLVKLRFLDFAGILAFNHKPAGWLESIFSEVIVLLQMVGLGILFAWVIKIISHYNLVLKGAIYGGLTWFIIYVLAVLNKVKGIYGVVDFNTSVINLVGSIIWGLTLGWALLFLNRKYEVRN